MSAQLKLAEPPNPIEHDSLLKIAVGQSRKSVIWKNRELLWSDLVQRLANNRVTGETLAEYRSSAKSRQDELKDIGGFVGGVLKGGRRKATTVESRYLLTLDADDVTSDLWASIELLCDFACVAYSTHSHTADSPRLRLVIPLKRAVSAEEYQAVARRVAADLGIDQFDPTTFEAHRLMYWPSSPVDVQPVFEVQDLPWLDPGAMLARYDDWRDPASWPEPAKAQSARQKLADRQEDPHEKNGIVGAFCRTYSIEEALETFLGDVYEEAADGRYTYAPGTTTGGLIVYDDGKFAYSHHGTDPVGGRLVNAFDLVRLHLYGELDDEAKEGTPTVRMPSYTAMVQMASEDGRVKATLGQEREAELVVDFGAGGDDEPDSTWMKKLEMTSKGDIKATRHNIVLILENDPRLAGKIALNEFLGRPGLRGDLPWRKISTGIAWQDRDDEALRHYLELGYGINSPGKTTDALGVLLTKSRFHPVRTYLGGLKWDGTPRLETLLIDYLGAEGTTYVRAVTRKSLTAAVARIMRPGCKFDYMLVLVGPQGVGKSLILKKLGREWFSDSLTTVQGKEAYEQLQGAWLLEMGELAATRRADVENLKHFVTKQEDIYRVAYGRQVSVFPRQCVFFGSTNDSTFLRDKSGNRRFWPVEVTGSSTKSLWDDLTEAEIDQVWAEAVVSYKGEEPLYLTPDLEAEAQAVQLAHTEESERAGSVREFLGLKLPADWEERDIAGRRQFLHGDFDPPAGEIKRQQVCVMEVWCELFRGEQSTLTRAMSMELHDILRTSPGWVPYPSGTGKLRFKLYGSQRAYVRLEGV